MTDRSDKFGYDDPSEIRIISRHVDKTGFDPNQPRDEDGRWTETGAQERANREPKGSRLSGQEWKDSLSDSENEALELYTEESSAINAALRSGRTHILVRALDRAINRAYLPNNTIVYRGLRFDSDQELEAWFGRGGPKVGQVHIERGFLSTGRKSWAEQYIVNPVPNKPERKRAILLRVNLPKGTRAADLGSETLVHRESKLRITHVGKQTSIAGIRTFVVEAEYIGGR